MLRWAAFFGMSAIQTSSLWDPRLHITNSYRRNILSSSSHPELWVMLEGLSVNVKFWFFLQHYQTLNDSGLSLLFWINGLYHLVCGDLCDGSSVERPGSAAALCAVQWAWTYLKTEVSCLLFLLSLCSIHSPSFYPSLSFPLSLHLSQGLSDEVVSGWQVLPWLTGQTQRVCVCVSTTERMCVCVCERACVCVCVCVCVSVRERDAARGHIGPVLQSMAGTKPRGHRVNDISLSFPSLSHLLYAGYSLENFCLTLSHPQRKKGGRGLNSLLFLTTEQAVTGAFVV